MADAEVNTLASNAGSSVEWHISWKKLLYCCVYVSRVFFIVSFTRYYACLLFVNMFVATFVWHSSWKSLLYCCVIVADMIASTQGKNDRH